VTSMFGSKFLMSVAMISLIALSLIDLNLYPFRLRLSGEFFRAWPKLFKNKSFFAISCVFWMPLVTIFWSADVGEWYTRIRMHIPFLGLAIAFLGMREWSLKTYDTILRYTVALSLGTAILVIFYYINSKTSSLDNISQGQSLWMPINHIRYSLLIAYSTVLCLYFGMKYYRQKSEALFWIVCGLFLFVFIHFIAVRSGIIALYVTLFIWLIINIIKQKNKKWAFLFVAIFVVSPFLALKYVPTLKEKISYMQWDLEQFQQGNKSISSDNRRLQSMVGGWEVFKQSPIIGVGAGDLKQEMKDYFKGRGDNFVFFPHNQYLYIMASAGIIGLIIFLFSMLFPMFYQSAYMLLPLLSIQLIAFVSFFVEYTFENAVGVAIFSFFIIMGLKSHQVSATRNLGA